MQWLWFHKMTVGTKLVGGFLLVAGIGMLIGISGIRKASEINDLAQLMYEREIIGLSHASEANIQLIMASRAIRSAILSTTEMERGQHVLNVQRALKSAREELDGATPFYVTEQGIAMLLDAKNTLKVYDTGIQNVVALMRNEPLSEGRKSVELVNQYRSVADKADDLLGKLVERKKATARKLNDETDLIYVQVRTLLIGLTIGGVVLGIFIGYLLTRGLTRQLGGEPGDVARLASDISSGDLTSSIDDSRARPGSVVAAMKTMQSSLLEVVSTVRTSSETIATGAQQIAVGNTDLSLRTEEQASSLEETAASMEELTSTVKSNAEMAGQASMLAQSASAAAHQGGNIVEKVVAMMGAINTSSQKISDIIGVIDGIAFQTNILALNAAVEAARAGEQGRGFAVVASEVRNLAKRSAEAAKEIKTLINDSVERVASGSQLVNSAGAAMVEIVLQVQRVSTLISDITTATSEQASGITQIGGAVNKLDQMTQQNAALVEQSAAAAGSLHQQVEQLIHAVSVFKIHRDRNALAMPSPQHIGTSIQAIAC